MFKPQIFIQKKIKGDKKTFWAFIAPVRLSSQFVQAC